MTRSKKTKSTDIEEIGRVIDEKNRDNFLNHFYPFTVTPRSMLFASFLTIPDLKFYACRTCFTHIALQVHADDIITFVNPSACVGIFGRAINVEVLTPEHYFVIGNYLYGIACCVRCYQSLGWRDVPLPPVPILPSDAMKGGRATIDLSQMVFWDGFQMLDAVTLQPI